MWRTEEDKGVFLEGEGGSITLIRCNYSVVANEVSHLTLSILGSWDHSSDSRSWDNEHKSQRRFSILYFSYYVQGFFLSLK